MAINDEASFGIDLLFVFSQTLKSQYTFFMRSTYCMRSNTLKINRFVSFWKVGNQIMEWFCKTLILVDSMDLMLDSIERRGLNYLSCLILVGPVHPLLSFSLQFYETSHLHYSTQRIQSSLSSINSPVWVWSWARPSTSDSFAYGSNFLFIEIY